LLIWKQKYAKSPLLPNLVTIFVPIYLNRYGKQEESVRLQGEIHSQKGEWETCGKIEARESE
jgi:hypothetical protein